MFSTDTVIAINGDLTVASEAELLGAHARSCASGPSVVILEFSGLEYINSGGVGLLVALLARAQRAAQRVVASGLAPEHRWIFEPTRLDVAIEIRDDHCAGACRRGVRGSSMSMQRSSSAQQARSLTRSFLAEHPSPGL